jgi:precorrin-3B synthase
MTAAVRMHARRGACPGLSAPMPTGDGLLARLMPAGTIGLAQMSGLCATARQHGNGIIEISARGNVQIRGLGDAAAFADAVAQLGIAAHDGVPVICDPLAGLDPAEVIDASRLAAELRHALATQDFGDRLAPKVCVAIDGGGALHLDAIAADIRLRAVDTPDSPRLEIALGGDTATSVLLGTIAPTDAVDMVLRLLGAIAAYGPQVRAGDAIRTERIDGPAPAPRAGAEPIGLHGLRSGRVAVGIGFPFGHTDAATLDNLARTARDCGASGFRTSPGRALLVLGIAPDDALEFTRAAQTLGFIVDPRDPRRRVVACAGAPICASGEIPARALAPEIARSAAPLLAANEVIHISGCAKGCAHHGAAALTAIGRAGACALLVDGAPAGACTADTLPQQLTQLARQRMHHG